MNELDYKIIMAYLRDSWSHRKIQKEILKIPAPARGGGFEVMKILHKYKISGEHKGILNGKNLTKEELESEFTEVLSKATLIIRADSTFPTKSDVELAYSQIASDAGGSVNAILDQVEKNAINDGKQFKPNWRIKTEENIKVRQPDLESFFNC